MTGDAPMIRVQTSISTRAGLVPFEQFAGPVDDEDYIEGALELVVDGTPVLTAAQVDYIDQLWAYLITGLEALGAGREFSTGYPDMPVEVTLHPQGDRLVLRVDARTRIAEVTIAADELQRAMVAAATRFFEHMRGLVVRRQPTYDRYLERLATIRRP